MKFYAENDLDLFEFHDSEFSFVSFDGDDLAITASMVNIHKNTPQNPSDHDLQISSATITFKKFRSATYEPGRTWKTGEDGKSYPVGPRVIFSGQDAIDKILEELRETLTVFYFEEQEDGTGYSIGGCGIEPYFTIEFDFESVIVSWEEYDGEAWYELHRQYSYDAVLRRVNGDETVNLTVSSHEGPVYHNGKLEQPPVVMVGCRFEGKEYWGRGSHDSWIDAFADFQRKLPDGVSLTCCLTCRYGNLSPAGNEKNKVFCTQDVLITQKSDLFFYAEDESEREKRSRQYCGLCENYQPQREDFYTHNAFMQYLKKA